MGFLLLSYLNKIEDLKGVSGTFEVKNFFIILSIRYIHSILRYLSDDFVTPSSGWHCRCQIQVGRD